MKRKTQLKCLSGLWLVIGLVIFALRLPAPAFSTSNLPAHTVVSTGLAENYSFASLANFSANQQPWLHINGLCGLALEGAVFGLANSGCGGTGTSFDALQIYSPVVIKDIASAATPCGLIAVGAICYRLWYVGEDSNSVSRIGYAVSPDGNNWTRVMGMGTGGGVLDVGAVGRFDSDSISYFSIVKDGLTFKMWYSGYDQNKGNGFTAGIGYATSTDGLNWIRLSGPLAGGAVYGKSGIPGAFDQDEAYVPFVIKDQATVQSPCSGVAAGATCYRMWYEGASNNGGYSFFIGYATSGDGINWTRVIGSANGGAILGKGPTGSFDENQVGIPVVVKDGALYRMWYEATDYNGNFTIGHVVSVDGLNWVRPTPNLPVYQGSDDPATLSPKNVWSHWVIKDGPIYRMWYTVSTKPISGRFGYATLTPGISFSSNPAVTISGNAYKLNFTTSTPIPAGGSVLLLLPPEIPLGEVSGLSLGGFEASAILSANPTAVSDAPATNVARGALVIRLLTLEAAGQKTVNFTLAQPPASTSSLLIQTFNDREVLEWGLVNLARTTNPCLTVNTATDTGSGVCGTLSGAINAANSASGGGSVVISLQNITTITLTSNLPPINNVNNLRVVLDGNCTLKQSGPGTPNLTIIKDSGGTATNGLTLGNQVSLRGLKIVGFNNGFALDIQGSNNEVTCSHLGRASSSDPTSYANGGGMQLGTTGLPGVSANNNQLGGFTNPQTGTTSQDNSSGNLISGNSGLAILVNKGVDNYIYNSWIGLAIDGNNIIKNGSGVRVNPGGQLIWRYANRVR